MNARDQLLRLHRIQELALETREAQQILASVPARLEEIESRFRERNAEYVAIKGRHDELDADQRARSAELKDLEAKSKKYRDDLMQVKNQREYAAMLKEIDSVKSQIAENEDAILRDMEEIESLKGDLRTHEEHIATERELVERERVEVRKTEEESRRKIAELEAARVEVETGLPGNRLATLRKLEETRQGVFLSKADNGTCLSCFVRVRPQVFQEIKAASRVHTCSNCRRFLYFEPSLEPQPDRAPAENEVEAVDGGAV